MDSMLITYILIFFSGVLTILAPSIWPLLPLILSSSATDTWRRPFGVVAGLMTSLLGFTLLVSRLVETLNIDPSWFRFTSTLTLLLIAACLLYPPLNMRLQGIAKHIGLFTARNNLVADDGLFGGFVTGIALGLIWAPFAAPVFKTIAQLTQQYNFSSTVILAMVCYVIGVGLPLLIAATWGGRLIRKLSQRQSADRKLEIFFGCTTLLSALIVATQFDDWVINVVFH